VVAAQLAATSVLFGCSYRQSFALSSRDVLAFLRATFSRAATVYDMVRNRVD
jgi:hypothetical protein